MKPNVSIWWQSISGGVSLISSTQLLEKAMKKLFSQSNNRRRRITGHWQKKLRGVNATIEGTSERWKFEVLLAIYRSQSKISRFLLFLSWWRTLRGCNNAQYLAVRRAHRFFAVQARLDKSWHISVAWEWEVLIRIYLVISQQVDLVKLFNMLVVLAGCASQVNMAPSFFSRGN